MRLIEYPDAIAQVEKVALKSQQRVRAVAEALESRKAEFTRIVANDPELTNEAKRKAAKAEMELTDGEFLRLQRQLQAVKDESVLAQIEADRLRNLFKAERLLLEQTIAAQRAA